MLLRQSVSSVAQQLLCACITADMRMHNTCCACVSQLLCANYYLNFLHTLFYTKSLFISIRIYLNMQINEKKDALPSRKRSASHIKLKIKILRLVFGIEDTATNLNQALERCTITNDGNLVTFFQSKLSSLL